MPDGLTITGISGVRPNRRHDLVHIDCSAEQQSVQFALHRGVLGTLIASLLQAARAFPGESDEFLSQPLKLTGVGVVSFEDGSFGLELLLDDGLRLFVAIPSGGVATLRNCVTVIDSLDGAMSVERSGMTQH
jgi:hypothetical protein